MSVYKRTNSNFYTYDFRLDGVRYSGQTHCADIKDALAYEDAIRREIATISGLCRSILKRAISSRKTAITSRKGFVYMLKSEYFIKIGHSIDPIERIRTLSTAMPTECEMLFCIRGGVELERSLHDEFRSCHYRNEWFFCCGKLKQFVEEFKQTASGMHDATHQIPPSRHTIRKLKQ